MNSIPHVSIDIEADGPVIGLHSMISFGAVIIEPGLKRTFYREVAPISSSWVPEALAVSGFTREQTLKFEKAEVVMPEFAAWLRKEIHGRPIFWADNNGFDAAWINYYFLMYNNMTNPFGHSSRRIADLFCGLEKNLRFQWKRLRDVKHTHNALDDAMGNASAMLKVEKLYGVKL